MLSYVKLLPVALDKHKPNDLIWIVQVFNDKREYVQPYEGVYTQALTVANMWRDFAGIPLEKVRK